MFLQCPGLAPTLDPIHRAFNALISEYDIIDIPMTHFEYLSLLLGADPCLYLQGIDRLDWITRLVPRLYPPGWVCRACLDTVTETPMLFPVEPCFDKQT